MRGFSLCGGVENASEHERGGQSDERHRSKNFGRGGPAERLDPKTKYGGAGELTEATRLLQEANGRRHRGWTWSGVRSGRVKGTRRKSADPKRKRGRKRNAL